MEDKEIINEIKQDFKTHEEKYKQIEEMYQEFLDYKDATLCKVFSYKGMCENFVDLGYQKVEKDDIVISRKEYEALKWIESYHIKSCGKGSVVLSREEAERLSSSHDIIFCDNKNCPDNLLCRCAEISECPRNIPEYNEKLSANKHKLELFQKLCKERERVNSWEVRYKLLQEELKNKNKETVEKLIAKIKQFLSNVETVVEDDKYSLYPEIGYKCSEVDDFIDELANNSMLVED